MAYLPPMNGGRLNASISAAGGAVFGSTVMSTGTINFVAGNNVTLSQATNSTGANITFSAPNAHNLSFGGNVTGAAQISTGTLSMYAGNNISFSQNANALTINGPAAGGGAGSNTLGMTNIGNTAGTAGYASGSALQYVFSGGNNVTLSQSLAGSSATLGISGPSLVNGNGFSFGSNAGSVTASYTGNANVNLSAGGSNANLSAVTFSNANGIGFGLSAGTITASHNAITSQTLQTANVIQGVMANGSTVNSGSVSFGNLNGVSFGMNGSVITASAAPDGIQGISAAGSSVGSGAITFSNSNNVNFGMAGSVITASANVAGGSIAVAGGGVTYTSGTANLAVGGGALSISSSVLNGSQSLNFYAPATSSITAANITLSTNGNTIGLSGPAMFDAGVSNIGNTAGNTGVSNTNGLVLVGGNNVSLSQSTNATGAYVTFNAGPNAVRWEYPSDGFSSIASNYTNNLLSIQHMYVPFNVTGASAKVGGSINVATTGSATTGSASVTLWMGIYTMNSNSSLGLVAGSSANNVFSINNTSNTGNNSSINGMRQLTTPLAVTMTAGEYWVAAMLATSTNYSANNFTFSMYGNPSIANAASGALLMPIGSGPAAARDVFLFQGVYSTTTAALPTAINSAGINNANASYVQRAAFYNLIYSATY